MNKVALRVAFAQGAGALATTLLGACGSTHSVLGIAPYRMEIQQGNYVPRDAIARLKVGMTRDQVRYLLGTPLVSDVFHANRWDYVFYRERADGTRAEARLAVVFEEGQLKSVSGDGMPELASPTSPRS